MKQLEKKDLIKDQIYKHINGPIFMWNINDSKYYLGSNNLPNEINYFGTVGFFDGNGITEATPEEKHWLEVCIAANSFIPYEEAIKTFIPEYVECIQSYTGNEKGVVYNIKEKPIWFKNYNSIENFAKIGYLNHWFKPSTKEAYDAQFVVKEPEFVLPEKWCIKFSHDKKLLDWCKENTQTNFKYFESLIITNDNYFHYPLNTTQVITRNSNYTEITFEQFKKYVLKEQLEEPKDKILEKEGIDLNIGKIIRVESSEGAIFEIGDKITVFTKDSSNKGKVFTIKGFRWNNAKTNICAITELHSKNGIGLDKIELYSKPVVKELSLLEQAKLKYPIGTEFKAARGNRNLYTVKSNDIFKENSDNAICIRENGNGTVYFNGEWAEIVEDFKLPETWWITVENERQLEIAKQYFSQYFNNLNVFRVGKTAGYVKNVLDNYPANAFNLLTTTKMNNPQITFEQFEQYVLHNGFKVGDRFNKIKSLLNHTAPYAINERKIIDLQYINNESVAFYKLVVNNYLAPQCRILTRNIVK